MQVFRELQKLLWTATPCYSAIRCQVEIGFSWFSAQILVVKLNENVSSLDVHLLYTNLGKKRRLVCSCEDYSYQQTRLEKCLGLEVKLLSHSLSLPILFFLYSSFFFFSYCKSRQSKCSPHVLRRGMISCVFS